MTYQKSERLQLKKNRFEHKEMRWIALVSTLLFSTASTCLTSSSRPSIPYAFDTKIPANYCILKNCHNCYRAINNDFGGKQSRVVCSAMYHQPGCCDFYIKRSKGILFWIFIYFCVLLSFVTFCRWKIYITCLILQWSINIEIVLVYYFDNWYAVDSISSKNKE